MGHEVEKAATGLGDVICAVFDEHRLLSPELVKNSGADVIIDFTQPDAVATNVRVAAKTSTPIVIGTTGWDRDKEKITKMISEGGIGCIYAANFSIGVNLFLRIVSQASRILHSADFDVYINEAHHRFKKDFPSGTALKIAEEILHSFTSKTQIQASLKQGEAPSAEALLISSIRGGSITGIHTVGFDSDSDHIELRHEAKSRQGFALGAVRAAHWIMDKKGIYQFEDHLHEIVLQTYG